MPSLLPHSTEVTKMVTAYLEDGLSQVEQAKSVLLKSTEFKMIFRISLAADAVLSKLASQKLNPKLKASRSIVLRTPFFIETKQVVVAETDLRRLIELVFWTVYFTDHPIEWQELTASTGQGFSRDQSKPIDFCAHQSLEFYINYADERMKGEPSGAAKEAITLLRRRKGELNASAHADPMSAVRPHHAVFDDIPKDALREFSKLQRDVFSGCCIVLAAFQKNKFDSLPPAYRAHFDWLVQKRIAKCIRQGAFGLDE